MIAISERDRHAAPNGILSAAMMAAGEIHLWRYVDQFGKRRIYPCKMTEEAAKRLRGRADRRVARDPGADGLDQRLAALAPAARVDRCFESSWETPQMRPL
jgi:hypothetical protein